MNTTQPTELEQLRFLLGVMQDHIPGCMLLVSGYDFGEADCTCGFDMRREALQLVMPPPRYISPEEDAADAVRREARAERFSALYNGHIPVSGDAALLLTQYKQLGRECERLNREIARLMRTLTLRDRQIAGLRRGEQR